MLSLTHTLLLSMPGATEWLIIAGAALVLFGGRKIPEFMRGLGKGIREFNDAKNDVKTELEEGLKQENKAKAKELESSSVTKSTSVKRTKAAVKKS